MTNPIHVFSALCANFDTAIDNQNMSDLNNWNPAEEAFGNKEFNSYDKGLGKRISDSKGTNGNGNSDDYGLYISGIPMEVTSIGLKKIFSDAGIVERAHVMKPGNESLPRAGFVHYKSMAEALKAIEMFNGKVIGKYTLRVCESKGKKESLERTNAMHGSYSNISKLSKLNLNPLLVEVNKADEKALCDEIDKLGKQLFEEFGLPPPSDIGPKHEGRVMKKKCEGIRAFCSNVSFESLPEEEFEIIITYAENPQNFYSQINSDDLLELEKLMVNLAKFCSSAQFDNNMNVTVGCYYAAKFSVDQRWYRAEVLEIIQVNKYSIRLVDFGNIDQVCKSNLRELPSEFTQLRSQAFQSSLAGLSDDRILWSEDACELMNQCCGKNFVAKKEKPTNGGISLHLYITEGEETMDLAKYLIDSGFFSETQVEHEENCLNDEKCDWNEYKISLFKELISQDKFQLAISHVINPRLLYCQRVGEELTRLEKLVIEITEFVKSKESSIQDLPEVNDICAAEFTGGYWYRAKVLQKKDENYKVHYIDYGNSDTVAPNKIRTLPKKYHNLPPQAFACSLSGCYSPSSGWEDNSIELLQACENAFLFASVKEEEGGRQDDIFPLVFYLKGEQTINELMISSGGAISTPPKKKPAPKMVKPMEDVQTKLEEKRKPPPMVEPKKEGPTMVGPKKSPPPMVQPKKGPPPLVEPKKEALVEVGPKPTLPVKPVIKETKLKIPDMNKILNLQNELKVAVIHADDPHSFYCQLLNEEQAKLDQLLEEITNFCMSDDRVLVDNIKHNGYYAAQFTDGKWYRAQVLSNNTEGIHVRYIDYGNTHVINKDMIVQLHEQFTALPMQAFKCMLAGCYPPIEGWNEDCNLSIKACVNNVFPAIYSPDESSSSCIALVLYLDDENTLNECLLENEMAVATPIKQNDAPKPELTQPEKAAPEPSAPAKPETWSDIKPVDVVPTTPVSEEVKPKSALTPSSLTSSAEKKKSNFKFLDSTPVKKFATCSPKKQPSVTFKDKIQPATVANAKVSTKACKAIPFCKVPARRAHVYLSNVVSVDHFSCRLFNKDSEYQRLMTELQDYCKDVSEVKVNKMEYCVAEVEGKWHRCQVINEVELEGDVKYVVRVIDTGAVCKVSQLKNLPQEFATLHVQAFDCKIAEQESLIGDTASLTRELKLQVGSQFTIYIDEEINGVYSVDLVTPLFDYEPVESRDFIDIIPLFDRPVQAIVKDFIDLDNFYCQLLDPAPTKIEVNDLLDCDEIIYNETYAIKAKDGEWKRCKLVAKVNPTKYLVKNMENGSVGVAPRHSIKKLESNYQVQTVQCKLDDCSGWTVEARQFMQQLSSKPDLSAVFRACDSGKHRYSVELHVNDTNIFEEMLQKNWVKKAQDNPTIDKKDIATSIPTCAVEENTICKTVLTSVKSPSWFYCAKFHKTATAGDISLITSNLNTFANKYKSFVGKMELEKGAYCVCRNEEGTWCRGKTVKADSTRYQVFLVDTGKFITVNKEDVLPMTKELSTIPAQVFRCHLCNLKPRDGSVWSSSATELISKLISSEIGIKINTSEVQANELSYAVEVPKFLNILIGAGEGFNDFI